MLRIALMSALLVLSWAATVLPSKDSFSLEEEVVQFVQGEQPAQGIEIVQSQREVSFGKVPRHAQRAAWKKIQKKKDKGAICDKVDWRKTSLKKVKEIPAAGLFQDLKGTSKWEASGMDFVHDKAYFIFDSLDFIGMTTEQYHFYSSENALIGQQGPEESGFEAIMHAEDTETFLIIREAIPHEKQLEIWQPSVVEARVMPDDTYQVLEECRVAYHFNSENKGWEGGAYFYNDDGDRFILGLCEGNWCEGGKKGRDAGNGRAILTKKGVDDNGDCVWDPIKEVPIPKEAAFIDYADIAVWNSKKTATIAIVSQENAAVWIGTLDKHKWEIQGPGVTHHFPRDAHCEKIYCNIEGVAFLDTYRLLTTSDRAKKDQPYGCVDRDQSLQIFLLPKPINETDPVPVDDLTSYPKPWLPSQRKDKSNPHPMV